KCKIVFMSRSAFPSEDRWDSISDPVLVQKVRILREIKQSGCEIELLSGDISDQAVMARAIKEVERRYGVLRGVVHLAGVTGEKVLQLSSDVTPDDCKYQFKAKLEGTCALDVSLSGRPLDFCVLFSSNAAVLGGIGMLTYGAANSFLDA